MHLCHSCRFQTRGESKELVLVRRGSKSKIGLVLPVWRSLPIYVGMEITEHSSIILQESRGDPTPSRPSDEQDSSLMSFKIRRSSKSTKVVLPRDSSSHQLESLDDASRSKRSSKSKSQDGDLPKGEPKTPYFDEGGSRTNSNNHLQCPTEKSGSPPPSRLSQLQSGPDTAGSSSSSSTFSSRTSSSSLDGISRFRLLNRQLSCRIKKSWSFRKMEQLTKKVRSHSDVGVYEGIIDGALEVPHHLRVEKPWPRHHLRPAMDLARQALILTVGSPQQAPPRVVEDPPTDSDGSSEGHRTSANLLIGSTGNFSAPVVSIGAPAPPAPRSAPTSPLQPPVVPAPSPHHDKSGKQPSWSGGEAGSGALEAAAAPLATPAPGSHKARQKKFHRHFPQASLEERVLNYYSCALVGDILLQGHLYITKNYFAFYSNVFGYVTKLLIPLSSVVRVSKEKMARIIPNAVGVTTVEDKHVFASLLSRDTTYKLMTQVLKASPAPVIELSPSPQELRLTKGESEVSLDEDSSCCSQSGTEEGGLGSGGVRGAPILGAPSLAPPSPHLRENSRLRGSRTPDTDAPVPGLASVAAEFSRKPSIPVLLAGTQGMRRRRGLSATPLPPPSPPPSAHSLLLLAATALLVVLFLSAGLLLYRIGKVGAPDGHMDDNVLMLKRGDDVYSQILKWHSQLHTKSAVQVHDFLHSNLDQIAKVRQSLETLSTLIGGIITDKMAPLDTRQGGYITRQGEHSSGESLRNANS